MKKYNFILVFGILIGMILGLVTFVPTTVRALGDVQLVNPLGGTDASPTGVTDISTILGSIIGKVLAILGSVTLLVFIVGGFFWLTSAGNAEKVKLGTSTMLYAIIGLFIIFASYAIINLMIGGIVGEKKEVVSTEVNTALSEDNKVCQAANPQFSCQPVSNCDGLTVRMDANEKELAADCTKIGTDKCINSKCNNSPDNVKCCLPKAGVTTGAAGAAAAGTIGERDKKCKTAEHPTWSCMDVDECNLNLTGKTKTKDKRSVCDTTKISCTTGKCNVGDDAKNLEIVCCEKTSAGKCELGVIAEICNKRTKQTCTTKDKLCTWSNNSCSSIIPSPTAELKKVTTACTSLAKNQATCIANTNCKWTNN